MAESYYEIQYRSRPRLRDYYKGHFTRNWVSLGGRMHFDTLAEAKEVMEQHSKKWFCEWRSEAEWKRLRPELPRPTSGDVTQYRVVKVEVICEEA